MIVGITAMRKAAGFALILTAMHGVSGCGNSLAPSVGMREVLKRTATTFDKFDAYMKRYDYTTVSPQMLRQLTVWLDDAMNAEPALHSKPLVTRVHKDASIRGHSDENGNGEVDGGEPLLFIVEIDSANGRLIASASEEGSAYSHRPRGGGFMAGYLVGAMLSRQRSAGIRHGHFNQRTVQNSGIRPATAGMNRAARPTTNRTSSSSYARQRPAPARYTSARGRARSGGVFRGK